MASDTILTVVGNLTSDPELRFSANGVAVVSFTVASTPRVFDRQANEWRDGDALFMRCSAWREMAENVAESLTKGTRVIVTGRLVQRSYEDKQGTTRTVFELQVDEIGPSLKYATAKVTRANRGGSFSDRQAAAREIDGKDAFGRSISSQPGGADDPWSTPGTSGAPF